MKKMDLMPTDENILQTLQDDMFRRNEKIGYFMQLLDSIEGSYTVALDGQWGSGKTFFIKQSKLVLEAYNPNIEKIDTATRQIVKNKMGVYIGGKGLQPQYPIYYDAWINDNDEDPIVSLLYSITEAYSFFQERRIESLNGVIEIGSEIIKMLRGPNIEKIKKLLASHSCMDAKKESFDLFTKINEFLEQLNLEKGNRLVIFIDELDRCKPTFAVTFLERIKHYFEHPNITFVFSVNMAELANTIQNYYGEGFEAGRYLNRFFDYTFHLPAVLMDEYYRVQGIDDGRLYYDKTIKTVIKTLHLELREVSRFLGICNVLRGKFRNISNIRYAFMENETVMYCAFFVIPVLLGVQNAEPDKYDDFIMGEYPKPFVDVLMGVLEGQPVNPFKSISGNSQPATVMKPFHAQHIYEALFLQSNQGKEIDIEGLIITDRLRTWVFNTASGLSSFSDFNQ